jgi:arabinofuranan 3-O-arabinosyltransferase
MILADATLSVPRSSVTLPKPFELFCFAFCVANLVWIATALVTGSFLWEPSGRLLSTDFVNVYAAGKLALAGNPAGAYDWPTHKQVEFAALGYDFRGYYGWHYPPFYLFVASALAMLPYVVAHAGWSLVSFIPYVVAVRASAANNFGYLLAFAMPAFVANVLVGQNGFLTAALIGGTLALLQRRPVLAGICLGFLTYKPHFGILFPLVLAAAGYWRVFFAAGVTAVAISLASAAVYGIEPWFAFLHWLPVTSQTFLSEGRAEIEKMQSLFAIVRTFGGAEWFAWSAQILLSATIAVLLCLMWRSKDYAFELKAAALGAGILLATPYIYLYDMVTMTIPLGFLFALGLSRGFLRYELWGFTAIMALIAIFPFVKFPVGFAASVLLAALIVRRAVHTRGRAAP